MSSVQILLNGGMNGKTFASSSGNFSLTGVSSGSYIIEVVSPTHLIDMVRIDVNSNGKVRVRQLDILKLGRIEILNDLNLQVRMPIHYFNERTPYRLKDILMSPMILFTLLPLLVLGLMKLVNTEGQELEAPSLFASLDQNPQKLPEMSEWLTDIFGTKTQKNAKVQEEKNSQLTNGGSCSTNNRKQNKRVKHQ
ncbi:hypothetical protein SNEBB_004558 [Seison nebaliae]|nr:hypothetical protein SNEBB_004558 [Seison nebaliae]